MGWLIGLGVLALIGALPLGIRASYNREGARIHVLAGPVSWKLYPRRGDKDPEKAKPQAEQSQTDQPRQKKPAPEPSHRVREPEASPPASTHGQGGSWTDFLPLVKVGMELLGAARRRILVRRLECRLILACEDPCDLAVSYGRTWAAVGNLMPQLERLFTIKKREINIDCDYEAKQTLVSAKVEMVMPLARLLALGVVYGFRVFQEYRNIQKKRKGGAVT